MNALNMCGVNFEDHAIARERPYFISVVHAGTVLGNGSYGCVREGVFCQQSVAVKSAQVSPDCSWEDVCAALANEANVLQHLKGKYNFS